MIKIVADNVEERDFVTNKILGSDKKIDALVYDNREYSFEGKNSYVSFLPDDQLTIEGFCMSVDEFLRSGTVHPEIVLIYTYDSISEYLEGMAKKLEDDKIVKMVIVVGSGSESEEV